MAYDLDRLGWWQLAGGADGERRLPLIVSDEDWDTLADRLYGLAPELETGELVTLLEALTATIDELDPAVATGEPQALARLVLSRVAGRWDAAHDPVPLPALGAWLRLARRLQPPPSRRRWPRRGPSCCRRRRRTRRTSLKCSGSPTG